MSFYLVMPPDVTPAGGEDAALGLLARAGMVAVRAADLASPCERGLGKNGRTALTAAGAGRIRTGDLVVWLKPVAVTRAVVRRDGRVQAAGHPADHARLGVAEQRLDELTGRPGVIDEIARAVTLAGKVKGAARRAMSPALAIRFTLLMTLAPDADYPEVMDILLGDLVLVPWQRPYRVPTAAAACTWREAIGPAPLERLQDLLLDGIDGEHRSRDYRAVMVGDLDVGSIDGSLIRVPDSAANRTAFGSAGTADDSSPYPQVRELRLSNASTRATFAVTTGPSGAGADRDKGEAEQALLDKALKDHRQVFTTWRLWVMDRNFPGVARIKAMLETGTHVLIRIRDGITLRRDDDFLPDGSYLAEISGGGITLTVRVIEYTVAVAGQDAPELFCLITDLHDHHAYPAETLARAYQWRWVGSETCLKEAKSAISGAGPSTGPILRSQSPALITQEHAAWVTAVELARAVARAAAAVAVPARCSQWPVGSSSACRSALAMRSRASAGTFFALVPADGDRRRRSHTAGLLSRRLVVWGHTYDCIPARRNDDRNCGKHRDFATTRRRLHVRARTVVLPRVGRLSRLGAPRGPIPTRRGVEDHGAASDGSLEGADDRRGHRVQPPAAVHQSGCQRASGRRREMHSRAAKRRPAVAPDDRARDRGPRPGQAASPLCPPPRTEGSPETTQEIEGDPRRGRRDR